MFIVDAAPSVDTVFVMLVSNITEEHEVLMFFLSHLSHFKAPNAHNNQPIHQNQPTYCISLLTVINESGKDSIWVLYIYNFKDAIMNH